MTKNHDRPGRTLLITGASSGIGGETAIRLAEGNTLLLQYRSSLRQAESVATTVEEHGGTAYLLHADLSNDEGCLQLFGEATKTTPRLDVLINNAGASLGSAPISKLSWNRIQEVFALNVFAAMRLTTLFAPILSEGTDPSIVNISSISARTGSPGNTAYGAAKGALDSFTRGAAKELAPRIRVNAVAPGVIDTPFHRGMSEEQKHSIRENTPAKMLGKPVHIARAISFLLENEFITGETIDVNGGLFMR